MVDDTAHRIDLFFVKIELKAPYVLQVPANKAQEALRKAYWMGIPSDKLFDIDKTAALNGPSLSEILRKAEERPTFQKQKRHDSPTS